MKVHATEETTVQAVRTLFANLATIRSIKPDDLLVPGRRTTYEKTLEETYAVIISLEKAFDHLATAKDVDFTVEAAKRDIQADINAVTAHLIRQVHSNTKRITALEEHTGAENPEKH